MVDVKKGVGSFLKEREEFVISCLDNVNQQLCKVDALKDKINGRTLEQIIDALDDMVEMLQLFPLPSKVTSTERINLIYPLMRLITICVAQDNKKQLESLVDILSFVFYLHLSHCDLFGHLVDLLVLDKDEVTLRFVKQVVQLLPDSALVNNCYMFWQWRVLLKSGSSHTESLSIMGSLGFLRTFLHKFNRYYGYVVRIEDYASEVEASRESQKRFTETLGNLISDMETYLDNEIISLIFQNSNTVRRLEELRISESSKLRIRYIDYVLDSMGYIFQRNRKFLDIDDNILEQNSVFPKAKQGINSNCKKCILVLLEVLDHQNSVDFLNSTTLISYISTSALALSTTSLQDKSELYRCFNEIRPKTSLLSMLCYLTFALSSYMLGIIDDDETCLPDHLKASFTDLKLPPFPKSSFFYDECKYDAFGNELRLMRGNDNFNQLKYILALFLNLINLLILDELTALAELTTSSKQNDVNVLLKALNNVFGATANAIFAFQRLDNVDFVTCDLITKLVSQIYGKVLSLRPLEHQTWLHFFNFIDDMCLSSLEYAPMFSKILKEMGLHESSSFPNDIPESRYRLLVQVKVLQSSQNNTNTNIAGNDSHVEIDISEFGFLYRSMGKITRGSIIGDESFDSLAHNAKTDSNTNMQRLTKQMNVFSINNDPAFSFEPEIRNISTPIRHKHANALKYQHSAHGDQFSKTLLSRD